MPASASAFVIVRDSTADDLGAIQAIYAHHVQHGTASFELDPPSSEDIRSRRRETTA